LDHERPARLPISAAADASSCFAQRSSSLPASIAGELDLGMYPGKQTATVYDYADTDVPVLAAMHAKRLRTYRSLGFAEVAVEP
jgi:hypothetical protein